ncbi:RtcB family protein [Paenibacillus sp. GCM10023252]|uniref:RtcB family protein n=1 Tax=Paenibacillus sp. GCM10023252 TaxID=3252649 RepID=UPI00360B2CF2
MNRIDHGNNHYEAALTHGSLHLYANEEVLAGFGERVYEMADNNLRIPRNRYMSYTPDAHVGIGTCIGTTAVWGWKDGFVSPSIVGVDIGCGMRVHLTPLHKKDIQDKAVRRQLIAAIERYVPTNERTNSNYKDINILDVVKHGLNGLPAKYVPNERWLTHVEEGCFQYDHTYLDHLPDKILHYAHGQLGTLGGGNHFIELQVLELNEEMKETADQWGLFDGQVVVMIHSGSRAWGARLGQTFTAQLKEAMFQWGVTNPDPNLIYAPIASREGQTYLHLMHSALNFAVSNRHMIAYGVEQAFKELFGPEMELPVLYDLMHNYALKEFHRNEPMLVHRKGATRALPPGHFLNREAYRTTGHPALIPGSMGTSSYLMVGRAEGAKNFYSICHGAGRARSRKATKELVTVDEFQASLRVGTEDEVLVNHRTLKTILDECPQAYKDVDQIIDSVIGAKLASVVARCKPMAAIKGV